ncbi:autotransporter outer membrane beta-barrel domain-containing protein [Caballeronia humi]|nr:autotransporter outer membrane beta-barrel domain-containing protein [Caballeronia humi]
MTDGTVTTSGDNAIGATAMGSGRIVLDNTRVQTSGVSATGASAASTSRIETTGGSIATTGDNASAMTAIDAGTTLATQGTTLATSGAQSHGISVDQNATASVNGGSIATSGAQSAGVVAKSAGTLALNDTIVTTSGAASHGAVLSRSGGLTMTSTTLTATGDNAHGISVEDQQGPGTPESVSLTGGAVRSTQGSAIRVEGASLAVQAKGDAQLSGANVLDVRTGAAGDAVAVSFSATDTVMLTGDIVSDAQSSVDVALDRTAAWTGAARNVGALSVSDDAVWNLNADSNVASASLAGGSVNFTPSSDGSFRTLNVAGGWNASASNGRNPTVTLNTTLNEGGAMSNQKTDRLLIAGDAKGSTTLNVRAQGAGAFTSTSVTPGSNEGISLVQVGGNASAQSFELQNGYVAVGPYQYHLSAFAPGASSAEQRLVAGSGDAFWDYRLNSVQVSEGGLAPEGNGSETPGNVAPPDGDVHANGGGAGDNGTNTVASAGTVGNGTDTVASAGTGGDGTDTAGIGATGGTANSGDAVANNGDAAAAAATPAPIDRAVRPDTRALLVPQAPSYLAAKTSLTHHLIDALPMLHARNGVPSIESDADAAASRGVYARTFGSNYTQHTDRSFMQYGSDFDMQSGGAQVGADVYKRKLGNGASVQFGVFGSYGSGRTSSNAVDGESRSSFDSIGGGVTATYRFSNGAYLDGVAKIDRLSDSFSTNGRDVASTRGMGYTFAAETGYARTLANNWFVDGRLALGMVNVSLADTTDADGIDVQFGSQTSAIGRADARVGREFGAGEKRVRPYVRAGLEGVSGGNTAVMLSGYRFNGSGVGNSWIAGMGIDARFGKSTTLSVDGGYRGNLGAAGAEGLEGNLTFKKAF